MTKPRATPYHCVLCLDEKGCGYHGILRFPNAETPTCDHHVVEGAVEANPHVDPLTIVNAYPVPMVPVAPRG